VGLGGFVVGRVRRKEEEKKKERKGKEENSWAFIDRYG